jgi:hypothetical protein
MRAYLMPNDQVKLWEAVNKYTESCGGDTSNNSISDKRMNAVVDIERAVIEIIERRIK